MIVDARPGSKENSPVVAFRLPAAIPAAVSLPNLIVAPVSEYVTSIFYVFRIAITIPTDAPPLYEHFPIP